MTAIRTMNRENVNVCKKVISNFIYTLVRLPQKNEAYLKQQVGHYKNLDRRLARVKTLFDLEPVDAMKIRELVFIYADNRFLEEEYFAQSIGAIEQLDCILDSTIESVAG